MRWVSPPSNAVPFFQEAYQNVRTGVSGHASELFTKGEHASYKMRERTVRTKTSSEDIVC